MQEWFLHSVPEVKELYSGFRAKRFHRSKRRAYAFFKEIRYIRSVVMIIILKYDELFTFENLLNAHYLARKGKRNKKDVIQFELNLSSNLWNLYDELNSRSYGISGYNHFDIYEPKKREIQALAYKDRIVQHVLCDSYLYPLLTNKFIYDNGACQKGKGTDFALDRLSIFFRQYYKENGNQGFILKADIRQFFPSIDHGVLKSMLRSIVIDSDILNLMFIIIDSYNADTGKGLPIGNQTSQLFALYYLDRMDRQVKERQHIKYYVRYMDDCILIHKDKDYLKYCLNRMKCVVEDELLLEFNEKTQIFPIKNGVEFLGFRFYVTNTGKVIRKLKTNSKKRFKRRLRKMKFEYSVGDRNLDDIRKTLPGYFGHLNRGHTYRLKKAALKDFVLINKGNNEEEFTNEEND